MPIFSPTLPLSLYIHIPWCVRKCPYCDFNSHEMKDGLPELLYINALLQELDSHLERVQHRPLASIFFGGGTPSLFSPRIIHQLLDGIAHKTTWHPQIEITMEANPGTIDQAHFRDFKQAGINRLSLGIQSFQNEKLKALGRIHDGDHAIRAIHIAEEAGFSNFNLDIMYGLPNQTIADSLSDIQTALAFKPAHFSWYQLTIEPNTLFYHQPPPLPTDDRIWEMQLAGQDLINHLGFKQYEVSAYSLPKKTCVHNTNYWEFGDYLGIGAGAHSKLTDNAGKVVRFAQVKNPRDYLDQSKRYSQQINTIAEKDLIFEFMLNALRLTQGVPANLFFQRTGIPLSRIEPILAVAKQRHLLLDNPSHICPSELGKKFLNDLTMLFM